MSPSLDALVARLERKWGMDRLPRLVPAELASKFRSAHDRFDREWSMATAERRAALAGMMERAWTALDAAAEAAGAEPMPPACFEAEWQPGRVFAIAVDDAHRQVLVLRNKAEGRDLAVFTIAEVAQLVASIPDVARIVELFPGAYLTAKPGRSSFAGRPLPRDEDIPFGSDAEGALADA